MFSLHLYFVFCFVFRFNFVFVFLFQNFNTFLYHFYDVILILKKNCNIKKAQKLTLMSFLGYHRFNL